MCHYHEHLKKGTLDLIKMETSQFVTLRHINIYILYIQSTKSEIF